MTKSIHQRVNENAENAVHLMFYKREWKDFTGWKYHQVMNMHVRYSLMRKVAKKLFDLGFDCNMSHITELRDIFKGNNE